MPPKTTSIPTPREETNLDPRPKVEVMGSMDDNWAVRLGWVEGVHVISKSRLRFLKEELGMAVTDNPDNYVL